MFDNPILLACLRQMRAGKINREVGICGNLDILLDKRRVNSAERERCNEAMEELFSTWPLWSGSKVFPVPDGEHAPHRAFYGYNDLWGTDHEYGRNRWNLLLYMIDVLEEHTDTTHCVAPIYTA